MTPLSVLDLSPIVEGGDAGQALRNTISLAQHTEQLGYRRFWLAEHHNFPGVASAATAVVIGCVAAATSRIRVGAGGVMLANHAPLLIAEQFGTLEALYPGRIDLGVGRAPGSDALTQRALRRDITSADRFPEDVRELMAWFEGGPNQRVRAVPGAGLNVPIWILGSSLFGAELAATLGLPYAFASHFAPAQLEDAIALYRARFRPSAQWKHPYVMVGVNAIAAERDDEAAYLASSLYQAFVALRRGTPRKLPPPVEGFERELTASERAMLEHALACSVVGSPETIQKGLRRICERTAADELIITAQIYDQRARLASFTLTAEAAM
jgi:luciferase family oxidoreductase group 1